MLRNAVSFFQMEGNQREMQDTAPDMTKNFWFSGVATPMRNKDAVNSATAAAALITPTTL